MKETAERIAKVGFKMFLGVSAQVVSFDADAAEFSLLLDDNPLAAYVVDLPDKYRGLWYSQVLCGVLRGALELLQMRVDVAFEADAVRGDSETRLRVKLVEFLADSVPAGEDD